MLYKWLRFVLALVIFFLFPLGLGMSISLIVVPWMLGHVQPAFLELGMGDLGLMICLVVTPMVIVASFGLLLLSTRRLWHGKLSLNSSKTEEIHS